MLQMTRSLNRPCILTLYQNAEGKTFWRLHPHRRRWTIIPGYRAVLYYHIRYHYR